MKWKCYNEKSCVILQEDEELLEAEANTQDKETNTECIFIPEQGKHRKLSAASVMPGIMHDDKNSIVIKRSQTFSPSAAVSRNHYICRVSFLLEILKLPSSHF